MRHSLSVHSRVLSVAVCTERPWQSEKCFTVLDVHMFTTMREDSSQTSSMPWEECERSYYGNTLSFSRVAKRDGLHREESKSVKPASFSKNLDSVK